MAWDIAEYPVVPNEETRERDAARAKLRVLISRFEKRIFPMYYDQNSTRYCAAGWAKEWNITTYWRDSERLARKAGISESLFGCVGSFNCVRIDNGLNHVEKISPKIWAATARAELARTEHECLNV